MENKSTVDQNCVLWYTGVIVKGNAMKRTPQPVSTYINADGVVVAVYPEKKVKRTLWQRGEAYLSQKMRIGDDNDRCFVRFSRKNGKY